MCHVVPYLAARISKTTKPAMLKPRPKLWVQLFTSSSLEILQNACSTLFVESLSLAVVTITKNKAGNGVIKG